MYSEKIRKNFIINYNNKKICAWSLYSKWPVFRYAVNQTTGGTHKTKLSTLPKQISLNIVPCFAIKWLKYTRNNRILSIQIMGKCIFALFKNFLFLLGSKISDLLFFLFCFTKQLCYPTYTLETCCSYLGCIKHTFISMGK